MRDPQRIPIVLEAIRRAWEATPDQRLGQLVANLARMVGPSGHATEPFQIEDDALIGRAAMWARPKDGRP